MLDRIKQEMAVVFRDAQQETDRLHRQFGGDADEEVAVFVDGQEQSPLASAQLRFQIPYGSGGQSFGDEATDPRVAGVVHHVQHDTRHG